MSTDTAAEPLSIDTAARALSADTLCAAYQATAAERPDQLAVRSHDGTVELTHAQLAARVRALSAGFAALGLGHGDRVAVMLTNRPEFHLVDTAAMHLGAVPFSVYNTSAPAQIAHVLTDAAPHIVVTERLFADAVKAAGVPAAHLVIVDGTEGDGTEGDSPGDGALSLGDVEAAGTADFDFDAAWSSVRPDDVLTLIYTSGTTGPPKGVEITHAAMMAEIRGLHEVMPVTPGGRLISYLPSAHVADRWTSHYSGLMTWGLTVTTCPDPKALIGLAAQLRPTFFGGVPRIWEKLKAALEVLFPGELAAGDPAGHQKIKEAIGLDQAEYFLTGAAPTPRDVQDFFGRIGIPLLEGWGMSETSGFAVVNRPGELRPGSVGRPLPGVEVRLADDGELLCRGAVVMRGYRNRPDLTAEAMDAGGWLRTGDVATIDGDGYVTIVDRKKEMIINAAGKNMSPANIENAIKAESPLIAHAVCVGDRRPYNVALIVLDPETGRSPADPATLAEVEAAVERANARLSRVEQIKKFTVIADDWAPGGDELTPTMKLKRKPIAARYGREIEDLYQRGSRLETDRHAQER
ncbi:AMP-dependent synthetase/ligase [Actinomadura rudentiformis]|uniref:Long-chain fatty acid--CoA ligase n=1 Tax=Actinomadura rudentiformis TaxID=359158 RepID=A0A6H9YCV3_9ACTN|nr:AMP-dependent synthetase/ligase [Actinomadura rudentiformis]KAB2343312.1 long-chain fatty acid--CoA ligase [Actinomadura rudentiformis]